MSTGRRDVLAAMTATEMTVRTVAPVASMEELSDEATLRPKNLEEFIGQAELREHLRIVRDAAKARSQSVDHLLFAGPPGRGKTTLAGIVAAELGVGLRIQFFNGSVTLPHCSPIFKTVMSCSLMRFIASPDLLKRCCIPQWRMENSILWLGKALKRVRFALISLPSRWSAQLLELDSLLHHFGTGLASLVASISTEMTNWQLW